MAEEQLTEAERLRLERIAQNKARLEALELPALVANIAEQAQHEKRVKKAAKKAKYMPDPAAGQRRSSRAAAAAATARLRDTAGDASGVVPALRDLPCTCWSVARVRSGCMQRC